jgi:hypothetical protein
VSLRAKQILYDADVTICRRGGVYARSGCLLLPSDVIIQMGNETDHVILPIRVILPRSGKRQLISSRQTNDAIRPVDACTIRLMPCILAMMPSGGLASEGELSFVPLQHAAKESGEPGRFAWLVGLCFGHFYSWGP